MQNRKMIKGYPYFRAHFSLMHIAQCCYILRSVFLNMENKESKTKQIAERLFFFSQVGFHWEDLQLRLLRQAQEQDIFLKNNFCS